MNKVAQIQPITISPNITNSKWFNLSANNSRKDARRDRFDQINHENNCQIKDQQNKGMVYK